MFRKILLITLLVCTSLPLWAAPFDNLVPSVKIVILLTIIPMIPFLLLTLTSFTRIIIVFSLFRGALATRGTPPNQVLIALALFMTFYIMRPTFEEINDTALQPYLSEKIKMNEAIDKGIMPLRKFMLKQVREKDLALFVHLSQDKKPKNVSEVPTTTIIPAFIVSELTRAFQIGFLIYLPFLIIDVVLASILLAMGMFMVPPMMISLPLKLLLFILVDGWGLLVGSLVKGFH